LLCRSARHLHHHSALVNPRSRQPRHQLRHPQPQPKTARHPAGPFLRTEPRSGYRYSDVPALVVWYRR
jgi:hypothetical protein